MMNKQETIAQIRQQLRRGELEPALDRLIEALESQRREQRDLANRALQAKARLQKIQTDEAAGVISFENSQLAYNQLSQQVIQLLEEWENPQAAKPQPRRRFTPKMIGVSVILLVFVGIIISQLMRQRQPPEQVAGTDCPLFNDRSQFNIMVMPYYPLSGAAIPLHVQITRRLDRVKNEYSGIPASVAKVERPLPETDSEAIDAGQRCRASLLIWGTSEKMTTPAEQYLIATNYRFMDLDQYFSFIKLTIDDKNEVDKTTGVSNIPTQGAFKDTLTSLTDVATDGTLTEFLESQIRLLFGLATLQADNPKLAVNILEEVTPVDSSAVLLRGMALAQSHLALGENEEAVEAYNEVLATHPNYRFALNNRALLFYQNEQYAEALDDINMQLEDESKSAAATAEALTLRGTIYMKAEQLKKARQDLNRASQLSPDSERVEKKIELLDKKIEDEEKKKQKAARRLRRDPDNTDALINFAEASRNLGQYEAADRAAIKVLQQDRDNTSAMAVRLEVAMETGSRPETAASMALPNTVPDRRILEHRPILKTYFRERRQQ